ncbi:DEAD/DEAH box helicase [Sneathiella litorea]|uniref:DEAD-box ATP-dependent RNA helicase RhpA n=1 Tax=Sneathiella litorea TaxID=2606216 RepID=A0A6L8W8H3_9PROT|nr:DEAD/DEAH box helicase [Sneathiella litorea]MZR30537.1 DEAD/DEAH box helicase [Sneathiella litorea]
MKFADLGLSPEVLKAVEETGYESPTPIQEKAIPYVLMGRDVLGTAQTGTGKTASFTLPMIDILASGQAKARMPRSLILEPTRELAAQVADNFENYGKYSKLSMALLIGGMSFSDQDAKLDKGVDVLIATPGRLLDHVERGKVLLNGVKTLVIDEADRMMDMGFIPDVERIVSLLPPLRQTLFFSATMSKEMRKLADMFLLNPKEVAVSLPTSTAATVTQGLLMVQKSEKRPALRKLLQQEKVKNAFIFCNRKKDVDILLGSLTKHGFNAGGLHGDMSQSHRMETLDKFKSGEIKLLVCSDVAARGIDVSSVSHVFNFDVPTHSEDYIHRIGRTGRAGQEGHAYTIVTKSETKYLDGIQKLVGRELPIITLEGMEEVVKEGAAISEREKKPGRGPRRGQRRSDEGASSAKSAQKETAPDEKKQSSRPSKKYEKNAEKGNNDRSSRSHHANDEPDTPVIGLGENIPAFFKIPLRKSAGK